MTTAMSICDTLNGKLVSGSCANCAREFTPADTFEDFKAHVARCGNSVGLADATDDQLRAECEQRGMGVWPRDANHPMQAISDITADRDHWKTVAEAMSVNLRAEQQRRSEEIRDHDAHEAKLARERDEWKRRAEAAEAREKLLRGGVMSCGHHHTHLPINGTECSACAKGDNAKAMACTDSPTMDALRVQERAAWESRQTPTRRVTLLDAGHYVDPWDFLEDA